MIEVLVFFVGFVASFLSGMAGGGGILIVMPFLLALNVSPVQAIATAKMGTLGLLVGSAVEVRGKKIVRKEYLWPLIIIAAAASIIGPQITLNTDPETIKIVSSIMIALTAIVSLVSYRIVGKNRSVSKLSLYAGFLLYFILTILLAGFGSGLGLLSTYALIILLGMTPIETIATRRVVGLVGTPLQLLSFIVAAQVDFKLGIALFLGSFLGSRLGVRISLKRGNNFVKKAMAITSLALVISLFI